MEEMFCENAGVLRNTVSSEIISAHCELLNPSCKMCNSSKITCKNIA